MKIEKQLIRLALISGGRAVSRLDSLPAGRGVVTGVGLEEVDDIANWQIVVYPRPVGVKVCLDLFDGVENATTLASVRLKDGKRKVKVTGAVSEKKLKRIVAEALND